MSGKMSYKKEGVLFYSIKNQENGESNRNAMGLAKYSAGAASGYANMFSTFKTSSLPSTKSPLAGADYAFPPKAGNKYYLPYDNTDTSDFTFEKETNPNAIDFGLPTRITCQNPGNWTVINQYQLDCLQSGSKPEDISGFTTFGNMKNGDGAPVENSSATCTVEKKGDKVVLVIAFTATMGEGDYFKVGVVSTNAEVAIINSYPGATGLTDPICITLCNKISELGRGQGMSTRKMSDVTGSPRPGTLINWTDYVIAPNNPVNSGIEKAQINEIGFIQTPEGSLSIRGTYDDPNFGAGGGSTTAITQATFKGSGTGKYANVSLVNITYDNTGDLLTGGKVPGLRKLVLYSEKWN